MIAVCLEIQTHPSLPQGRIFGRANKIGFLDDAIGFFARICRGLEGRVQLRQVAVLKKLCVFSFPGLMSSVININWGYDYPFES